LKFDLQILCLFADQIKRLLPYLQKESEDCLYLNLYVASVGELKKEMEVLGRV
jgi:carboxylesterase type B